MFRSNSRSVHYVVLAAVHLLLTLPNLGAHTLWDMDEGVNAEAAREMRESGNHITPYYNYTLRSAKPALLYWLIQPSYELFGINEFGARLPAVLCGLGTVLLTYELARRLFSPSSGLMAGIALASCFEFCLISHACTPDPPLLLFTTLAFYLYWRGSEGDRRWWFVPTAMATGLGVLTKGPVGVALPGLAILVHLIWSRQMRKLWDWRLLLAAGAFLLTAGPWYAMVAVDSRGKWIQGFFMNENLKRFSEPAEGHKGNFLLHAILLLPLFAPWSVFIIGTVWNAVRQCRRPLAEPGTDQANKYRFLSAWFLSYLVFFSISATKLPNYILPLYPALAILTGRAIDRWRTGDMPFPRWVPMAAGVGLGFVGVVLGLGLLLAAGRVPIDIKGLKPLPALGAYWWLGIVPLVASIAMIWAIRRGQRDRAVNACVAGAVGFLALVASLPTVAMNEYKCPVSLVQEANLHQPERDIRIAAFQWLRHSVVFYARREVKKIDTISDLNEFLSLKRPGYVIIPVPVWERIQAEVTVPTRELARHYDFYARCDVLVLANPYID